MHVLNPFEYIYVYSTVCMTQIMCVRLCEVSNYGQYLGSHVVEEEDRV